MHRNDRRAADTTHPHHQLHPHTAVEEGVLTKCDGQRYKLTPEQRKVCVLCRVGRVVDVTLWAGAFGGVSLWGRIPPPFLRCVGVWVWMRQGG